MDRIKLIYI